MLFNIDFHKIISQTLMITTFVMVMMMVIEYLNVKSRGDWSKKLQDRPFLQIIMAAVLGIIPGCLGAYTIVSLYAHEVIRFSALVTAMIATSGDEAFVMFGLIPEYALLINGILFAVSIMVGLILLYSGKKFEFFSVAPGHMVVHQHEIDSLKKTKTSVKDNLKNISFVRAVLIFGVVVFLIGMLTGFIHHEHFDITPLTGEEVHQHDHDHSHHDHTHHDHSSHDHSSHDHSAQGNLHSDHSHFHIDWLLITYFIVMGLALFVFLTSSDHFLEDHLWGHVIKKHFLKIAGWSFGAMLFVAVVSQFYVLNEVVAENLWWVLLLALVIGLIPESGPHIVFVIMFFQGFIPFSILLASSIVQDGHGALPLLAESRKSFFTMKAINILVGFIVGALGLWIGF